MKYLTFIIVVLIAVSAMAQTSYRIIDPRTGQYITVVEEVTRSFTIQRIAVNRDSCVYKVAAIGSGWQYPVVVKSELLKTATGDPVTLIMRNKHESVELRMGDYQFHDYMLIDSNNNVLRLSLTPPKLTNRY